MKDTTLFAKLNSPQKLNNFDMRGCQKTLTSDISFCVGNQGMSDLKNLQDKYQQEDKLERLKK